MTRRLRAQARAAVTEWSLGLIRRTPAAKQARSKDSSNSRRRRQSRISASSMGSPGLVAHRMVSRMVQIMWRTGRAQTVSTVVLNRHATRRCLLPLPLIFPTAVPRSIRCKGVPLYPSRRYSLRRLRPRIRAPARSERVGSCAGSARTTSIVDVTAVGGDSKVVGDSTVHIAFYDGLEMGYYRGGRGHQGSCTGNHWSRPTRQKAHNRRLMFWGDCMETAPLVADMGKLDR